MKRSFLLAVVVALFGCGPSHSGDPESASSDIHAGSTIAVNGAQRFQTIVGLGVNGQPRMWGSGVAVKPALDALVKEMGATVWRVEVNMGLSDWETTNDDADPMHFNWTYYDNLFSSTKSFQDLWAYVRYLNSLGVTNIELAAHGTAPAWMGGINVPSSLFDEYVETQMAVLEYATVRIPNPKPIFRWYSPSNEPDLHGPPEGILLDPGEAATITSKMTQRLTAEAAAHPELAAIQIVAPEVGTESVAAPGGSYRTALVQDAIVTSKLAAVSHHRYPAGASFDWNGQAIPEWLTETAGQGQPRCGTGIDWPVGSTLASGTIAALNAGNQAVLVWTEYDAPHSHDQDQWLTFGLMSTDIPGWGTPCGVTNKVPTQAQLDTASYSRRPTYQAFRQIAAFVRPGAQRIRATTTDVDLAITAILNPDGTPVVFGVNSSFAGNVTVSLAGIPAQPITMSVWTTNQSASFVQSQPVIMLNGSATFAIPATSVFAIAAMPGSACVTLDAGQDAVTPPPPPPADAMSPDATPPDATSSDATRPDSMPPDATPSDATPSDAMPPPAPDAGSAPRVAVGESTQWSVSDSIGSGSVESFEYTASITSSVTRLFVYVTDVGLSARIALYTDAGNTPQTLLASGSFTTVAGWNQVTIATTPVTAGTNYWIAILPTNGTLHFVEKSGNSGLGSISQGAGLSALPATWSTTGQRRWASSGMSAYARE